MSLKYRLGCRVTGEQGVTEALIADAAPRVQLVLDAVGAINGVSYTVELGEEGDIAFLAEPPDGEALVYRMGLCPRSEWESLEAEIQAERLESKLGHGLYFNPAGFGKVMAATDEFDGIMDPPVRLFFHALAPRVSMLDTLKTAYPQPLRGNPYRTRALEEVQPWLARLPDLQEVLKEAEFTNADRFSRGLRQQPGAVFVW